MKDFVISCAITNFYLKKEGTEKKEERKMYRTLER